VVSALVEGNSLRSIVRMTGVAINTVTKLLVDMGCASAAYHHRHVRNVRVRRLQCDEIWQFIGAKKKNVTPEQEQKGWGDSWTWTAIDADTKLCVTYYVGNRDRFAAYNFMCDCADRIVGRPQITTDAYRPYLQAIEDAFGTEVDYAQLHKIYGASTSDESRYSPATCIGCDMKTVMGDPDPKHVSTSLRGAPKSHDAHVHAALYSPDKRIQQEAGEPRPHGCAVLHTLQLLPRSQDTAGYASNGSGFIRSRLDVIRIGQFIGNKGT
jgi:IS1 family transposase